MAQTGTTSDRSKVTCYICGEKGHYCTECPKINDIPKHKWFINKKEQHFTTAEKARCKEQMKEYKEQQVKPEATKKVSWSGVQRTYMGFQKVKKGICLQESHHKTYDMVDLSVDLALDTRATFLSVKNRKLLSNIKMSDNPITMCTNVGERPLLETGEILGLKDALWLDEESMANFICFANLADQYHITYDNVVEDNFMIDTENGTVKFGRSKDGLYTYRLSDEYKKVVVEENKKRKEISNFTTLAEN